MGTDVYKLVTDTIVERMKQGKIPWKSPYTVRGLRCAVSHGSKEPYSFINQFLLMEPGEYFTFNQVQKEGFRIKKGSKAKFVVFWKMLSYSEAKKIGEFVEESEAELRNARVIPFLRKYNVFHESDIEGFEREKYDEEVDAAKKLTRRRTPNFSDRQTILSMGMQTHQEAPNSKLLIVFLTTHLLSMSSNAHKKHSSSPCLSITKPYITN